MGFWNVEGSSAYAVISGTLTVRSLSRRSLGHALIAYTFSKVRNEWRSGRRLGAVHRSCTNVISQIFPSATISFMSSESIAVAQDTSVLGRWSAMPRIQKRCQPKRPDVLPRCQQCARQRGGGTWRYRCAAHYQKKRGVDVRRRERQPLQKERHDNLRRTRNLNPPSASGVTTSCYRPAIAPCPRAGPSDRRKLMACEGSLNGSGAM